MNQKVRRYDIDALRVLATLLLIVFHTGMVFTAFDYWHIQNAQRSEFIGHVLGFIHQWHMPLFFLLAGASTYLALNVRTSRQYVGERFKRLFVPLLVGILLVIPPQVYIERIATWVPTRISPINFSGSFFAWYPQALQPIYPEGNLSYHHMWFVAYLFVYSLLLLPLLMYLRRPKGQALLQRFTDFLAQGYNIFLPAVVIAFVEIALRWRFPNWQDLIHDWANNVHYPLLFVLGFVLMSNGRITETIYRYRHVGLVLGLAASTLRLIDVPDPAGYVLSMGLRGMAEWSLLIAFLGYGYQFLNRPSKLLRHTSEIAYPFYIWHQTVIVVIAFFIVRWEASIGVKFAVIGVAALVVTWLICEAIKLTNVTRVMFGLKPKRRQKAAQAIPVGSQPQ